MSTTAEKAAVKRAFGEVTERQSKPRSVAHDMSGKLTKERAAELRTKLGQMVDKGPRGSHSGPMTKPRGTGGRTPPGGRRS